MKLIRILRATEGAEVVDISKGEVVATIISSELYLGPHCMNGDCKRGR